MNRFRLLSAWLVIAALAFVLQAAPIVPVGRKAPDETRCLARIEKVGVRVSGTPGELTDVLDRERVALVVRQRLRAADFEIVDDPDVPQLVLNFKTLTDAAWPDVIGVVLLLDVEQRVDVVRLGERMRLPTTTVVSRSLSTRDQLAQVIEERCRNATTQFIKLARRIEE